MYRNFNFLNVKGLYEDLNVRIPPGTDSHSELTLSGRGIKHMERYNAYGDHIGENIWAGGYILGCLLY